ncbi:nitroreductase family protein [Clostridium sp. KNHs214]|uniref:nitroreductase family protein n=1 Tax=Clostridium sp. KNHs214 TaxID=1540257 RepID=UPI0005525137|nr:nitroreductase family protein [Clostridium sp. KNHs214]
MNTIIENIKKRRSIRDYKKEQIKEEELQAILEAAIYAPSGCNAQSWHFTVIQDRELINLMSNVAKEKLKTSSDEGFRNMANNKDLDLTHGAPTLVVVSGRQDAYSPLTDCSAAIQNMLLVAESLDIGSLWIGLIGLSFDHEEVARKLNIPEGYKPYYGVAFGYKGSGEVRAPRRKENVISYIR